MKKRGELLESETLKIVIAVICIGILIYLLVSLYFALSGEEEKKQAQAIISGEHGIAAEINRISAGGTETAQGFLVPNPSGWYIFSFAGEEKKPNLCIQQNCICICRNILINLFDRQIKACDDKGACTAVSILKKFERIEIGKAGTYISIKKVNGEIEIAKK